MRETRIVAWANRLREGGRETLTRLGLRRWVRRIRRSISRMGRWALDPRSEDGNPKETGRSDTHGRGLWILLGMYLMLVGRRGLGRRRGRDFALSISNHRLQSQTAIKRDRRSVAGI